MPLYDYDVLGPDGQPTGQRVEVFQHMRDPHLTHLPTGEPCRRAVVAVALGIREFGTGDESRMYSFHPAQAAAMRQELQTDLIQDDGRVIYRTNQDAKKFADKMNAYWRSMAPEPEKPKRKAAPMTNDDKRALVRKVREKIRAKKSGRAG
jgi:hypothetical protein